MHTFPSLLQQAEPSGANLTGSFLSAQGAVSRSSIAVCVLGPCSDPGLFRRTVQAVLEQDYGGAVIAVVPSVAAPDRQSFSDPAREQPRIVVRSSSLQLDSGSAFEVALSLQPLPEFIALINCGQRPPRRWLHSLKEAQEEFDADVVTGPVKAIFDNPPPAWMVAGAHFDRCGVRSGPIARMPAPDNSLIRSATIRSCWPDLFSGRRLETSWIDFAYRMEKSGAVAVWGSEAIVFHSIPASRMTEEWLLTEAYSRAYALARARSRSRPNAMDQAFGRLGAYGRMVAAHVSYGASLGSSHRARLMLARAKGSLAATAGSRRQQETA